MTAQLVHVINLKEEKLPTAHFYDTIHRNWKSQKKESQQNLTITHCIVLTCGKIKKVVPKTLVSAAEV